MFYLNIIAHIINILLFICAGNIIHNIWGYSRYSLYERFIFLFTFYLLVSVEILVILCFVWYSFYSWVVFNKLNYLIVFFRSYYYFFLNFLSVYWTNSFLLFSFIFLSKIIIISLCNICSCGSENRAPFDRPLCLNFASQSSLALCCKICQLLLCYFLYIPPSLIGYPQIRCWCTFCERCFKK